MPIEDISSDPTLGSVPASTLARREGKDVPPSIKPGDGGVLESTASIAGNVPALTSARREGQDVPPSIKPGDGDVLESTASITGNVPASTSARREGKDVLPSIKPGDGSVFESTASITGNVPASTSARREGKDVLPSIKPGDGGVFESTDSITQDTMDALVKDIQQLPPLCNEFNDFSFKAKDVAPSIKRQFKHVFSSKSYAQNLQKEVRKLEDETKRVHNPAEEARNSLWNVDSRVTEWQANAEKNLKEVGDLLGNFEKATKTCCYGTLPDPYRHHQFRRKAKDKIKDIQQLVRECSEFNSPALVSTVPSIKLRDDGIFESRSLIIQDIIHAFADNSNSVVGVYGMGGVGKSTLLVDAEKRIRKEKLFNLVAKAHGLDLKSVGIPCGHDNKAIGCKLLLTSRNQDVLRREMCCDKVFHLGGLQDEEAKKLFERIVGGKVHDDAFKPLVDEALHNCAGVPFLILAIAKRFKDSSLSQWKDALKQVKMDKEISEVINKILQLCYDDLKDQEAKLLLQLCVVYGVYDPSLENLVRYGKGLGLFGEESSIEEARKRLSSLICTLQASSLLLDSGDANGFEIHDLVREFVASVASRDHPLLVLKDKDKSITTLLKDKLKDCWAICFPYNDMKEFPKELDCPELRIFLLFTNEESLHISDSLFNSMRKLMVLNLTGIHLTCSSLSVHLLENLRTLCLDSCLLDDVAILGKLKGLQILSFVNSNIQCLPKEIGQLAELRLLDLNHCSQLKIIEPGVLGSLFKLEELYMENSFDKWNAGEQTPPINASLIELNNMKNLYTLYVSISDPTTIPEDLNIKNLTKYGISIGGRCWSSHKGSRTLELKLNQVRDILQKGCIKIALDRTDELYLDMENEIEQSICKLFPEGSPNLKHLHVENSPSIHSIFRQIIWDNQIYFQHLKTLDVSHCHRLIYMFTSTIAGNLVALTKLMISNCKRLTEVISNEGCKEGHVVAFNQLKHMEFDGLAWLRCFSSGEYILMFPLLGDVIVTRCPNMKFFSKGPIEAPKLEKVHASIAAWFWKENLNLTIQNMYEEMATIAGVKSPRLSEFLDLIEKWHNKLIPESFSKLETLVVDKCPFVNVIPSTLMLALPNVRSLQVRDCESLEEIFDLEGPEGVEGTQVLPQLSQLGLINLPKLTRLGNKNLQRRLPFNSLSHLILYKCNNLRHAFTPSMI
ncbi:hypothetical protein BT93_F2809 [Corymbia citriodora subsp. variegata]|nr:hypothetical protein BT93_F2809 [Corymbia citriodora subsp. variegata]